jgi:hypothetical protein
MSLQVAGIAGADVFGAAPYANIINVKTHGMYGANAGGVSRGKSKSLHKSWSLQFSFQALEDQQQRLCYVQNILKLKRACRYSFGSIATRRSFDS